MSASSKRRATSDLNHDNWDRETEPEAAGTFQTANENELKNRVIRKAVRRIAGSSDKPGDAGDGATKSVFSGFSGFGKTSSTATTASTLSSLSSNDTNKASVGPANTFSFLTKFAATPTETKTDNAKETKLSFGKKDNTAVTPSDSSKYNFEKSNDYYAKLKGLNQAVSSWIKTHVDKNPLCLLTPIFKDYEKYLEEINKNEDSSACDKKSDPQSMSNFKFQAANSSTSTSTSTSNIFSFASKNKDSTDANATEPKKTSIFGNSTTSSDDAAKPTTGFSFGLKTDASSGQSIFSAPPSTGFSFGGAKPFSFGNVQPPPAAEKPADDKENGEDDEDEPPKVEFKAVVEEDSVYSKRCKVFVKNDGNFADRGVGTLYLKPVKDSEKKQLLVRADTNLGNILVNLILNDSIPTQRMGKNNVMLVCIPTPETEKPTPMLLRVKTSEEADELLETIDKYKK